MILYIKLLIHLHFKNGLYVDIYVLSTSLKFKFYSLYKLVGTWLRSHPMLGDDAAEGVIVPI